MLDTMAWLWSVGPTEKIGSAGLEVLTNGEAELYLSAGSPWEVAIKPLRPGWAGSPSRSSRSPPSPRGCQLRAFVPWPSTQNHTLKVYDLPFHHRDPSDRLLIAQAMLEEMTVLIADRAFAKYPVDIRWCGK
jgi:PIN domain nuclease of toxin-antitoxin system